MISRLVQLCPVVYGPGAISQVGDICKEMGITRAFIVTGPHVNASGVVKKATDAMDAAGVAYEIYDGCLRDAPDYTVEEAGNAAKAFGADGIIGIGGGSVLDAAKTAAIAANNPSLDEKGVYQLAWAKKPLPLILIGTTAGTGSEVTYVSVMTNENGMKKSIHHDDLYAKYAFSDPRYTASMPYPVRVSTAIDALAHLLESYFNNKADDISRAYVYEGIRLLYPKLLKLHSKEELSMEDLETIYNASILGGMAINITGTVFCHTLGYYFTETYHLPHGFACALFTNDLLEYEDTHHKEYSDRLYETLQISKEDLEKLIAGLLPDYDLHLSEEEIRNLLPRYENNGSVKNTYGNMNIKDIEEVLSGLG